MHEDAVFIKWTTTLLGVPSIQVRSFIWPAAESAKRGIVDWTIPFDIVDTMSNGDEAGEKIIDMIDGSTVVVMDWPTGEL